MIASRTAIAANRLRIAGIRVIFFTAVLRIRAVPVAVVAAFNFDRRPPRAVQPPAQFEP